jgi:hypothetical protein
VHLSVAHARDQIASGITGIRFATRASRSVDSSMYRWLSAKEIGQQRSREEKKTANRPTEAVAAPACKCGRK